MATVYKTFLNNDKTATRTLLHEAIPITGTIVSGTYISADTETNIKDYGHGMFQSVYDYPYLSSSANHIFDVSMGYSALTASAAVLGLAGGNPYLSNLSSSISQQNAKKVNMYASMAKVLNGYDEFGRILPFDRNGDLSGTGGAKLKEVFFLTFSRLLVKDEIKKGSFSITFNTGSLAAAPIGSKTIQDHGAATNYKVNSPAGEYGLLLTSSTSKPATAVGLIYYQAGLVVMTASVFGGFSTNARVATSYPTQTVWTGSAAHTGDNVRQGFISGTIKANCNSLRRRLKYLSFNNTTELNSTIYFCRASHNEFNYSSNPTYLTGSKIRVKESTLDNPATYLTTVGLYGADNELLAVAKLSEPLKKTPDNELTLRVRLDY